MDRWYVIGGVALAMAFVGLIGCGGGKAQTPSQAGGTTAAPRTPWGEPDLQGIWNSMVITPQQRPAEYADREFLTEAEVADLEKKAARSALGIGRDVRALKGTPEDVEGAYNNVFTGTGSGGAHYDRSRRTSLIIDPPNGKMPPLTDEGKALRASSPETRFGVAGENGDVKPPPILGADGKPVTLTYARAGGKGKGADGNLRPGLDLQGRSNDNPEDRNDIERCRGLTSAGSGGFSRIVQAPGHITWYQEQGHGGGGYRIIPTDNRPHLPETTRFWLGDSVGHWEGDTLVIDTTNFRNQSTQNGVGNEKLHLIERLTRLNATDLRYQVTTIKPNMYASPFTTQKTLMLEDGAKSQIYESYCYEGNYALTSMLAGARAEEKAAGVKGRPKTN